VKAGVAEALDGDPGGARPQLRARGELANAEKGPATGGFFAAQLPPRCTGFPVITLGAFRRTMISYSSAIQPMIRAFV
jgi:hypothetical protein